MNRTKATLRLLKGDQALEWVAALERKHFIIDRFGTIEELLAAPSPEANHPILVYLDRVPIRLEQLKLLTELPVILIQSKESSDLAFTARACGVSDYLREPVSAGDVISSVEACLAEMHSRRPWDRLPALLGGDRMVGSGRAMNELRQKIAQVAATDCNVLITGETGTGKELAAELIHHNSARKQHRLVCVNCAAIPEALLESELFGYEQGAFTGAHFSKPGQMETADGGVMFFDEIGEMSFGAQAKLLRAIEHKEVHRLGRRTGIKIDARIICATNRDLEAEVKKGAFRADLFFRLNVAHLRLPPLRERKEDLRELADLYFREINARMGLEVNSFTEHSWRALVNYDWPGNVREFKNVIESSLVQIPYPRMRSAELPEKFHQQFAANSTEPDESKTMLAALIGHNWNKSKAAQQLRWSRMTLYRKMAKYQLSSDRKAQARTA